jgi:hypothetical protein
VARPQKIIDPEMVKKLSNIGCTNQEMASILDCSPDTLERRFAVLIEKGRSEMRTSLRRRQYMKAMDGDTGMLVWLGKQLLGQRDQRDVNIDAVMKVQMVTNVDES